MIGPFKKARNIFIENSECCLPLREQEKFGIKVKYRKDRDYFAFVLKSHLSCYGPLACKSCTLAL